MKASIQMVSPEVASMLLKKNTTNRKLNEDRAKELANQIVRGAWQSTGESISIARDGTLLNGQHRLRAIELSGVTVPIVIVSDVDKEAFSVMDSGVNRTLADVLHVNSEANANILASAIKYVLVLERYGHPSTLNSRLYTNDELVDYLDARPEIRDSVTFITSMNNRPFVSPALMAAFHYLFKKAYPEKADEYVRGIIDHDQVDSNSVMSYVFGRLLKDSRKHTARMSLREKAEIIVRGWNYYVSGEDVRSSLRSRSSGGRPGRKPKSSTIHKFPAIRKK